MLADSDTTSTKLASDLGASPEQLVATPSSTSWSVADNKDKHQHAEPEPHLVLDEDIRWTVSYRVRRRLGSGGQGVVYLADRMGADEFRIPVALKMFSPNRYRNLESYREDMRRISSVTAQVALIQQDHLLDVHNLIERDGLRIMVMEWIDGYDLRHLLEPRRLEQIRARVSDQQWSHLNRVVFSLGPSHIRLQPGIANAIVRECLAGLAALHRANILHGDIKPSNIMIKKTGNAKLIDLGAAIETDGMVQTPVTPRYAAPEVLRGEPPTPASDLASLGYVLIELLAGVSPFEGLSRRGDLLRAKEQLPSRLSEFLPDQILRSESLRSLIWGLCSPDPSERFPNAEAADLVEDGAASFNRELITGDLASEFDSEIRAWLAALE